MLYYLVTLQAKQASFFFQAMSKLFSKSCTFPNNNIEKDLLQIYYQNNYKTMKYTFLQVFITIGNTKSTH